jgi:hypothetical protein
MKFAPFEDRDKKAVYVNPALVTCVKEINESACLIYFGPGHSVEIPMQVSLVVKDLQRSA